jgi:hypothetical protein
MSEEVYLPRPITDDQINRALREAVDLPVMTPEEEASQGSPTNTEVIEPAPADALTEATVPLEGEFIPEGFEDDDGCPNDPDVVAARQELYDEAEEAPEYVPTPEEVAAHENAQLPIQPITIVFNSTGLGVFIGRALLEHALLNGNFGNAPGLPALAVRSGEQFTKCVGRALQAQDEEGGTLITRALDRAIQAAVDATIAEVPDTGLVVGDVIPLDAAPDPDTVSSLL